MEEAGRKEFQAEETGAWGLTCRGCSGNSRSCGWMECQMCEGTVTAVAGSYKPWTSSGKEVGLDLASNREVLRFSEPVSGMVRVVFYIN